MLRHSILKAGKLDYRDKAFAGGRAWGPCCLWGVLILVLCFTKKVEWAVKWAVP